MKRVQFRMLAVTVCAAAFVRMVSGETVTTSGGTWDEVWNAVNRPSETRSSAVGTCTGVFDSRIAGVHATPVGTVDSRYRDVAESTAQGLDTRPPMGMFLIFR